ncbi:hypothetical protein [Rubellimicrobium aerolatum]|uniref:Uncharacterized protein n=1 Tax=Rubellimicrobium aerolatum TaxID=490979 RepID=A0ABW0SA01_9RHOB|nr:hypothetical protein [Rubellimicrobium aerolatum]MBP1805040.1 hypothetical protein [Rubellimicrobium aerolatum]
MGHRQATAAMTLDPIGFGEGAGPSTPSVEATPERDEARLHLLELTVAAREAEIAELARRAQAAEAAAVEARTRARALEAELAERYREIATLSRLHLAASAGAGASARSGADAERLVSAGPEAVRQALASREAELRQIKRQHDRLLASTSWRLTAPVRRVSDWLRSR